MVIGTLYTLSISSGIDQLRGGTHCDRASTLYCKYTLSISTGIDQLRGGTHCDSSSTLYCKYTLSISTGIDQLRGGTHRDSSSTLYCSTSNTRKRYSNRCVIVQFNDCSDNGFTQPAAAGMHWSPNCGSGHTEADLEGGPGVMRAPHP